LAHLPLLRNPHTPSVAPHASHLSRKAAVHLFLAGSAGHT
jgi:hypothetical protein